MSELSSARHELFEQGVASGLPGSEAYRRAIGKGKNADVHAAEFLARPGIKERIAEIRAAAAEVPHELMEKEFLSLAATEGIADIEELNKILERAVNLKNFLKGRDRIQKVAGYVADHLSRECRTARLQSIPCSCGSGGMRSLRGGIGRNSAT